MHEYQGDEQSKALLVQILTAKNTRRSSSFAQELKTEEQNKKHPPKTKLFHRGNGTKVQNLILIDIF